MMRNNDGWLVDSEGRGVRSPSGITNEWSTRDGEHCLVRIYPDGSVGRGRSTNRREAILMAVADAGKSRKRS
jgi:hypothetical protein